MKNLMNKIRKSNKGFTLVELIIVIAIIAVLSAVIAPQYLKYVDKSKISADEDLISRVYSAAQVALVDDGYTLKDGDTIAISSGANGGITVTAASGSQICAAMQEYFGQSFTSGTANTVEKLEKYTSATFTVEIPGTGETFNPHITQNIVK